MTHAALRRRWKTAVIWCALIAASGRVDAMDLLRPDRNTDYAATMAAADREATLMIVYFFDDNDPRCRRFERELASSEALRCRLDAYRCVCLPMDAEITCGGKHIRLIEHPAFSELEGGPGIVVLDFSMDDVAERGRVLRTLPFRANRGLKVEDYGFLPNRTGDVLLSPKPFEWLSDYAEASALAERERRMLLIYFERPDGKGGCAEFEKQALSDGAVREELSSYVCLKLACDAKVNLKGHEIVLLKHASFSEMVGLPGIAIVDYTSPDAAYYDQVVSTFPFLHDRPYDIAQMEVILKLPPGELTQRTLIYAVRTHPDAPQSTSGQFDPYLVSEAESHSAYQAKVHLQGHQAWETRFHRINHRLPGGLLAAEVCAESWPGECLLEAAIDCVQCWRMSSGHWRSVRAAHPMFAYDMRRGSNGIWYATGIFAKRGH